ncbi:unnamed protein product [Rotaria sp. Silwood2]|nr:unnamed protein product [Rotaria sp. Silwood2]
MYATDKGPQSVAVGDLNNDSRLDIVVGNAGSNNVSVFFGYGNGSFTNQITYSTGEMPYSVAVGDINNDNRLDIIVTNYYDNVVSILLGYGNGSFANQITCSTGQFPYSVAVGDFNNDNQLDIVVTNYYDNVVSILLGYGNGSFTNQITYPTGEKPYSVAAGDFNNDNRLDIVVANAESNDVSVLLGYGNGSFAQQTTYVTGRYPQSVAVGNFNNDTGSEIVVANAIGNSISVLLGYINIGFIHETRIPSGNDLRSRSFATGDFNNDDQMDIAVTNMNSHSIGIFLGFGNISFTTEATYSTGSSSSPYSMAVGDFNKDSRLDIVVANYGSGNVGIFLGYGNGSFINQTTYSTGPNSDPYSVSVGDFNNDTILDIVVANQGTNIVGILLGYGDGSFASMIPFSMGYGSQPFSVVVGDFNRDSKLDLIVANDGTDSLYILLQTC